MTLSERTRQARSGETRQALIRAGLDLFGRQGFDGTSTRDLAGHAGTNPASIAYHFGNKHGLRRAWGAWIDGEIGGVAGAARPRGGAAPDRDVARQVLLNIPDVMAGFILSRRREDDFIPFLLREITEPGEVFHQIYTDLFAPMHARFCHVWASATGGDAGAPRTRLEVFALIGQLLYFRIGREAVLRRMEWNAYGKDEIAAISDVCKANLAALIDAALVRNRQDQTP